MRKEYETSFFHIIVQGIGKEYIFNREKDIRIFEEENIMNSIEKLLKKNNGIITTSEVEELGINSRILTRMIERGIIERVAIAKKFEYRESMDKLKDINEIMESIKDSEVLRQHWRNYQSKFSYAEDISYEDTMKVLEEIIDII